MNLRSQQKYQIKKTCYAKKSWAQRWKSTFLFHHLLYIWTFCCSVRMNKQQLFYTSLILFQHNRWSRLWWYSYYKRDTKYIWKWKLCSLTNIHTSGISNRRWEEERNGFGCLPVSLIETFGFLPESDWFLYFGKL